VSFYRTKNFKLFTCGMEMQYKHRDTNNAKRVSPCLSKDCTCCRPKIDNQLLPRKKLRHLKLDLFSID
jgi:hypothetical protein